MLLSPQNLLLPEFSDLRVAMQPRQIVIEYLATLRTMRVAWVFNVVKER
jgi:hypothetical protein